MEASGKIDLKPRDRRAPALLSVVCPAYNEEASLDAFYEAVASELTTLGQPFEIILVNDGSSDETLRVMKALRDRKSSIAIVDLSRNYGKEIAITAGLDHAKGDAAIIMDADLQHPPRLIGEMIAGWREGYDVVYAQRRGRKDESWLRRVTAQSFYNLMNNVGETPLPPNAGDFRLLSRKAVDAVISLREHHRFMKGVFAWVGFPSKAIPFDVEKRVAGTSKWDFWKLWNFSIEGVTSHTLAPLKMSTYLGLIVAGFSFAYGAFIIVKALFFGDPVPGFPTLAALVLFLGGVQLVVLGVIGEYLGRVFNETKNRPLYFTNDVLGAEQNRESQANEEKAAAGGSAA